LLCLALSIFFTIYTPDASAPIDILHGCDGLGEALLPRRRAWIMAYPP
jgi:hypothetical protein